MTSGQQGLPSLFWMISVLEDDKSVTLPFQMQTWGEGHVGDGQCRLDHRTPAAQFALLSGPAGQSLTTTAAMTFQLYKGKGQFFLFFLSINKFYKVH